MTTPPDHNLAVVGEATSSPTNFVLYGRVSTEDNESGLGHRLTSSPAAAR